MALPSDWECEVQLFSEDLFSDLISRHPIFWVLPPVERNSDRKSHFTEDIGKCVVCVWHTLRQILEPKLGWDFPRYAESQEMFKTYLESLCDLVYENTSRDDGNESELISTSEKVIIFSAVLLEMISFLYRRRVTHFLHSAPYHWCLMLKKLGYNEFYRQGGWADLDSLAKKNSEIYDDKIKEFNKEFWCPKSEKFESAETSNAASKIKCPVSTEFSSSDITDISLGIDKVVSASSSVEENQTLTCTNESESAKVDLNKASKIQDDSKNIFEKDENYDKKSKIQSTVSTKSSSEEFIGEFSADPAKGEFSCPSVKVHESETCSSVSKSIKEESIKSDVIQEESVISKSFSKQESSKNIPLKKIEAIPPKYKSGRLSLTESKNTASSLRTPKSTKQSGTPEPKSTQSKLTASAENKPLASKKPSATEKTPVKVDLKDINRRMSLPKGFSPFVPKSTVKEFSTERNPTHVTGKTSKLKSKYAPPHASVTSRRRQNVASGTLPTIVIDDREQTTIASSFFKQAVGSTSLESKTLEGVPSSSKHTAPETNIQAKDLKSAPVPRHRTDKQPALSTEEKATETAKSSESLPDCKTSSRALFKTSTVERKKNPKKDTTKNPDNKQLPRWH